MIDGENSAGKHMADIKENQEDEQEEAGRVIQ